MGHRAWDRDGYTGPFKATVETEARLAAFFVSNEKVSLWGVQKLMLMLMGIDPLAEGFSWGALPEDARETCLAWCMEFFEDQIARVKRARLN